MQRGVQRDEDAKLDDKVEQDERWCVCGGCGRDGRGDDEVVVKLLD
jgi:hypothetical protein